MPMPPEIAKADGKMKGLEDDNGGVIWFEAVSRWWEELQVGVVKETDALQSQILVLLYIFSAEQIYHSQGSFSVLCLD